MGDSSGDQYEGEWNRATILECCSVLDGERFVLVFNSTVVENKNGDLKSIYGTRPDITTDDGRSALKVCLDLIENQYSQ